MKKNKKTEILMLLDRTGSMSCIADDAIGGFNSFLEIQKKEPKNTKLSLVQFDSQDPFEIIHSSKNVLSIPDLNTKIYQPRGATPLFDAIGRGINYLEEKICNKKKNETPDEVIMVIITDGHENASIEFRLEQIKKMIDIKENEKNWQFVFIGCDLSGMRDASNMGIRNSRSMRFRRDSEGTKKAFMSASMQIHQLKMNKIDEIEFSDEDRGHQNQK